MCSAAQRVPCLPSDIMLSETLYCTTSHWGMPKHLYRTHPPAVDWREFPPQKHQYWGRRKTWHQGLKFLRQKQSTFLMSEFKLSCTSELHVRPPLMLVIKDMIVGRGENMNSVSSKWSMVCLLLWSCSQVEDGACLLRLHSRDSQVSSLRNMTNCTAAP